MGRRKCMSERPQLIGGQIHFEPSHLRGAGSPGVGADPTTSHTATGVNYIPRFSCCRLYPHWIEQVGCHIPLSDQSRTRVWGGQAAANAQGLASWITLTLNLSVGCSLGWRGSGPGGKSDLAE